MPCDAPVTIATRCALTMRGLIVGARAPGKRLVMEILFHRAEESTSRSGISFSVGSYAAIPGGQRTYGERTMRIAISMAALVGGILVIAGAVKAQQPAARIRWI